MISKPLIEEIISLANNELLIAIFSKAFRGFNREELDIPINNLYLSFMPEETKISYFEDDTATTCRKTEFTLKMTVYAPATRRGEQVQAIAEVVADFLSDKYMGEMTGYTIGDLSYDDGVNALTLPTHFRFVYYECPLEGVDDAPADTVPDTFFCKSHINNGDILLFNDVTRDILYTVRDHAATGAFSTFKISSYPANLLNAGQCIFAIDSTAGATWMGSNAPLIDISEDKLVQFETEVMLIPQYDTENPQMISQGPSMCVFNKEDPQEVLHRGCSLSIFSPTMYR